MSLLSEGVLILDFGSQYTQLIARRSRELGVYSEIRPAAIGLEEIRKIAPAAIVLSGGPSSVFDGDSVHYNLEDLTKIGPVFGVCYGLQMAMHNGGGEVHRSKRREYGLAKIKWEESGDFQKVWMSHGDHVEAVPEGFEVLARSSDGIISAVRGDRFLGFQFHPEVSHTENGKSLISEFLFGVCKLQAKWEAHNIAEHLVESIRRKVPQSENVICAMSGGVDSTVVGVLMTRALGASRVNCVFVDTGLLRKDEAEQVMDTYLSLGLNVRKLDARKDFLTALADIEDPEQKRKAIGRVFLEVFERSIDKTKVQWLAQGTLYPDVIESVSVSGKSVTIKSHHNVGGLPERMHLKLVEPLRELFKDEVRAVGEELGIERGVLWRHPFPGPGLAIRILGPVNESDLSVLRECDAVFIDELKKLDLYNQIWQAFCVLLPIKTVGVQGDGRSYERVLALRAVTSIDGMTADWFDFPSDFLRRISSRITNEIPQINRIVYDVTSKPPGTIEWE
ncbi:MAG: glutamine-hydrolyzing GMP synthase [Bdellovibrionales bacterium CG10_big_fil_rev_8_21_14_0_10_45_34]|nr:MAG: glutamine-hydrolyzing GMP synthase [Bdellovibrionales bacterium CG10_big_fil_rev_8_21_14_0_10_45_34]